MGYNTNYSLTVLIDGVEDERLISELRAENEYAEYAIDEGGRNYEACKWYKHEAELKEFSRKNPGFLFELHGEGEEAGDIWNKYFLDGKMQICKAVVIYPPFDKDKLQ